MRLKMLTVKWWLILALFIFLQSSLITEVPKVSGHGVDYGQNTRVKYTIENMVGNVESRDWFSQRIFLWLAPSVQQPNQWFYALFISMATHIQLTSIVRVDLSNGTMSIIHNITATNTGIDVVGVKDSVSGE